MNEKVCFFTLVSDDYYYPIGTPKFINSFKRFHPDIDLVVFRNDIITKVFKEKDIDFYNAKPTFAKLLAAHYDLVVNIDADTIITGRLDPVLADDYEVGGAWNFNEYENATFDNITPEMYVQAGLVGSRNPKFWDIWEQANSQSRNYVRRENDILNLVWYNNPEVSKMKRKIYDKDFGFIGCKALNKEDKFYLNDGKLMCEEQPVWAYHWAKGGVFPKLQFDKLPFTKDVQDYLNVCAEWGTTVRYGAF